MLHVIHQIIEQLRPQIVGHWIIVHLIRHGCQAMPVLMRWIQVRGQIICGCMYIIVRLPVYGTLDDQARIYFVSDYRSFWLVLYLDIVYI
jgi:hypothetical protein